MNYPGSLRKSDLTLTELQRFDQEMRQRGKSSDTMWTLWGLMSYFGAHRFYLGDNGYATAMFATSFVPLVGLLIQLIVSSGDSPTSISLFWFFIFWLGASAIWSWVDGFFVNGRIARFNHELEIRILAEIALDRAH